MREVSVIGRDDLPRLRLLVDTCPHCGRAIDAIRVHTREIRLARAVGDESFVAHVRREGFAVPCGCPLAYSLHYEKVPE